jgi:hypothetical protein
LLIYIVEVRDEPIERIFYLSVGEIPWPGLVLGLFNWPRSEIKCARRRRPIKTAAPLLSNKNEAGSGVGAGDELNWILSMAT